MTAMRPLKSLISIKEAFDLLSEEVKPIDRKVALPLIEAGGRVLAQEVVASCHVPPFARAAMDGYALKAQETFGTSSNHPGQLNLLEVIHAGEMPSRVVAAGQCIQVGTGAPMPAGADAVVMVEDTEREGEVIKVYKPLYPGANVTLQGSDIPLGQKLFEPGAVLTPAMVGVLAALGWERVLLYEQPQVGIIPSGNEIIPPGRPLGPGQIYDVNSYTLAALVKENGCSPRLFEVLPDSEEGIKAGLLKALGECDLLVLSGGSSAGERDVMIDALASLGQILFHGIAVKPGKPTLGTRIQDKLVLVMPGYPTSCLTNAYFLLIPLVRRMARLPEFRPRKVKGFLTRKVTSTVGRYQFLTVRVHGQEAEPAFKESGAITSMALADGYVEIPEYVDLLDKGEEVEVTLF